MKLKIEFVKMVREVHDFPILAGGLVSLTVPQPGELIVESVDLDAALVRLSREGAVINSVTCVDEVDHEDR